MATYRLEGYTILEEPTSALSTPGLSDNVLLSNSHWFISVRWIVIIVFVISGITGRVFSRNFVDLGFVIPVVPLLFMAALLLLINICFYLFSRTVAEDDHRRISIILWIQIVLDLIFVTTLVYFIGSTDTFIPFIYLIHIVLSCIFFSKSRSFVVVCIAASLYLGCVTLQNTEILERQSAIISAWDEGAWNSVVRIIYAFSAVLIWFILWYFISTLSDAVRERDLSLQIANKELQFADREKTRQVLITTHDLKAPFAGIESNINVLKYIHWEELSESCRVLIDKIEVRSKTLRERIKQILDLGNLRTQIDNEIRIGPVSLKNIFDNVIGDIADQILERKIDLITDIKDIIVNSNEEKLKILFLNLVSNAVFYTPEKGEIEIEIKDLKDEVEVIVRDTGIGIEDKYLHKIFNEYFRTPDAARFNKMSSGLGLQIVKTIAEQLRLSLTVESEKNKGTTFTIGIKH